MAIRVTYTSILAKSERPLEISSLQTVDVGRCKPQRAREWAKPSVAEVCENGVGDISNRRLKLMHLFP